MPETIRLILNPTSNQQAAAEAADALRPRLASLDVEWCSTESPRHAVELARRAGEAGCRLVIAAGGDGTVHEVINGLMQVPQAQRPALGIIPLGSGNDFAHILGIPADPLMALEACLSGQPRSLDVGSVRDGDGRLEYFNNTIGIGFDAAVTLRARRITWVQGFMMYFAATLQTIFRDFTPMDLHVETDEETWDQPTIMLTLGNGPREGGGFIVTPDARLDDGVLNYCTIRRISRLTMLRLVPQVMKGTQARFAQVRMGTCRRMQVTSRQPLYVHCDGEIFAGFDSRNLSLGIEILPAALSVMQQ